MIEDLSVYEIENKPFGFSYNSKLYKAIFRDRNGKETVCSVEIFNSHSLQSDAEKSNFMTSITNQSQLKHIAVLPLLHYCVPLNKDGNYKIVTPYMAHGNLEHLLNEVSMGKAPNDWETIK